MAPVPSFTRKAIAAGAAADLSPGCVVVSDGLACFRGVVDAGCQPVPIIVGRRKPKDLPDFLWLNTVLGNLKTSLGGAYHVFDFATYGERDLGTFAYRFNRRFRLDKLPAPLVLLIAALPALAAAYRYRLRWPLLIALLLVFQALGGWHAYGGHGAYFADIRDRSLMILASIASIFVGHWHEAELEEGSLRRHADFGKLDIVFGLLYLNLSLWFMSLDTDGAGPVLLFTAAAVAQFVVGAARKDSRFTGFGIVFLGIDLYTRLFEHFWDRLSAGAFLSLAGLLGMGLGALFERRGTCREVAP